MSDILKDLRDMADLLAAGEIDYVDDGLLRRAAARIHHLEISSAQPAPAQREAVQVKPLESCVERRHGFGIHIGRGLGFLYEAAMKAYSPGIGPAQWVPDFVWGPAIATPAELRRAALSVEQEEGR